MRAQSRPLLRREFLALGAAAFTPLSASPASPAAFRGVGLDHVVLRVTDPVKSAEFYRKHFGAPEIRLDEAQGRFLRLGREYVALVEGDRPGLDHFAISIDDFDPAAVESRTQEMSLDPRRDGSRVTVRDPGGISVEIAPRHPSAGAEVVREAPGESTFRGAGVNHIALRTTDLDRSAEFYGSVLGMPIVTQSESNRFLGLDGNFVALFLGDQPRMDHFCLEIEDHDAGQVVAKLQSQGIEPRRTADRVYFPDPDGIEVQVSAVGHGPD